MQKSILHFLLSSLALIGSRSILAQQNPENEAKYNLLNVPTSPAFILLDVEPVTVEEPVNPTDFFASLRNATTGFSDFPNTYAVNFAPFWVFGGGNFEYDHFISGKNVGQNIGQTMLVSMGVLTQPFEDTLELTKASVGFKFSFWPGEVDTFYDDFYLKRKFVQNKVKKVRVAFDMKAEQRLSQDSTYLSIQSLISKEIDKENPDMVLLTLLGESRDKIENSIRDKVLAEYESELVSIYDSISEMTFRRYGPFLDMAGGAAWRFPNNTVGDARLDRFGIWLTGGVRTKKNLHFIGTLRFLNFQDQTFVNQDDNMLEEDNNFYLDAGTRVVYRRDRFGLSLEAVARVTLNRSTIKNTSRIAFNIDYQLGKNQVLDFTFGKNFDDTVEKGGNLIAVLNFLIGFGSKRKY